MNRTRISKIFSKCMGIKNWARFLSFLKYQQSFTKEYTQTGSNNAESSPTQTYIFMADGKAFHGGLSDRLRGIFSVYDFCKNNHKAFKINFISPFNLIEYLEPNQYNWYIDRTKLSHNKKNVSFRFFNSYSHVNNNRDDYYQLLSSTKNEVHVYSNVTINEQLYNQYFQELFKPSFILEQAIQKCLKEIESPTYISITFRFQALLGDLKERNFPILKDENEKAIYITKCLNAIKFLHDKNPNKKILVTSDSFTFLNYAKKLDYVYIIPGKIEHMDYTHNKDIALHLKSFIDLLMISKAETIYTYSYGMMFKGSRFAYTAALIGGKKFITLEL